MKNAFIGAAVGIAAVVALRRYGPQLEERAKAKCQEMMATKNEATPTAPACGCA